MSENPGTKTLASPYLALWSLLALYAAARFLPSIFTMGAFVLFAWLRLAEQNKETPSQ